MSGSDDLDADLVWIGTIEPCRRVDGHTPSNGIHHPGPPGRLFYLAVMMLTRINGIETQIDEEHLHLLSRYRWFKNIDRRGNIYFSAIVLQPDGSRKGLRLHRVIMNCPPGKVVDHINRDTLDNRKENLRICSVSQNTVNSKVQSNNTSGYKGVSFNKALQRWIARTKKDGKEYHCGSFNNPEDAYSAYCKKAKELHGEYIRFE